MNKRAIAVLKGLLCRSRTKKRRWPSPGFIACGLIIGLTLVILALPSHASAASSRGSQVVGQQSGNVDSHASAQARAGRLTIPARASKPQKATASRGPCDGITDATLKRICEDAHTEACVQAAAYPGCPHENSGQIQNLITRGSTLFYFTPYGLTVNNDQVKLIWKTMLTVADVFVALIIMLHGIRMILAGTVFRYADAVEGLPGMVLALIVAHLSLALITFVLGLSNTMTAELYTWTAQNVKMAAPLVIPGQTHTERSQTPIQGAQCSPHFATNNLDTIDYYNCTVQDTFHFLPDNLKFTEKSSLFDYFDNLNDMMLLTVKMLALMLLAQMVVRLFFINLYIVLSPLGLVSWAFPGRTGQPLTYMWFEGFFSTVLVQFVQVAGMISAQFVFGLIINFATSNIHNGLDSSLILAFLQVVFLWFILRIPALLGTVTMDSLVEVGQTMSEAVGSTITLQFQRDQANFTTGIGLAGIGVALFF